MSKFAISVGCAFDPFSDHVPGERANRSKKILSSQNVLTLENDYAVNGPIPVALISKSKPPTDKTENISH
jgi:hypothetical protein